MYISAWYGSNFTVPLYSSLLNTPMLSVSCSHVVRLEKFLQRHLPPPSPFSMPPPLSILLSSPRTTIRAQARTTRIQIPAAGTSIPHTCLLTNIQQSPWALNIHNSLVRALDIRFQGIEDLAVDLT